MPKGGIKERIAIRPIRTIGPIKLISLIRLIWLKLFKFLKLLKFLKSPKLLTKSVKATPTKPAIQVAQVPVKAIVRPESNKNNELRAMNNDLEEDRICVTINGRSRAKIAVVEKAEPDVVKLIPCVQGGGNILAPIYVKRLTPARICEAIMLKVKIHLISFAFFKLLTNTK